MKDGGRQGRGAWRCERGKGVSVRPADTVYTSIDANDNVGPQSVATPVVDPALSPARSAPPDKAFTPSDALEPATAAENTLGVLAAV